MLIRPRWASWPPSLSLVGVKGFAESVQVSPEARVGMDDPTAEPALGPLPAEWFHAHVDRMWRVVSRLGIPAHSVDDVLQEAFIIASRRRAEIGTGQERAFLIATAVRLCSNYRQRAHVRREIGSTDDFERSASAEPDAEQLLIEKRLRQLLDRVLDQLSDEHRTAFVLFELEGYSVPEIAQLLELPLGTASARVWRARHKFSELAAALQAGLDQESP